MKTYLLIMVCVAVWEEGKCGAWKQVPVVETDAIYLCRRIEAVIKQELPTAQTECSDARPDRGLSRFGRRDSWERRDPRCDGPARYEAMREGADCS